MHGINILHSPFFSLFQHPLSNFVSVYNSISLEAAKIIEKTCGEKYKNRKYPNIVPDEIWVIPSPRLCPYGWKISKLWKQKCQQVAYTVSSNVTTMPL